MSKLTDKQRAFVAEYCKDFNGTQAAIRAGYAPKSAEVTASKLLRNAKVQPLIAERVHEHLERAELSASRVFEEYRRIVFAQITDFLSFGPKGVVWKDSDEIGEEAIAAIAEVSETISEGGRTRRFKLHNKLSALSDLAKIMQMFPKDGSASGPSVNVNVNLGERPARPLSDLSDEELDFYESMFADDSRVPND